VYYFKIFVAERAKIGSESIPLLLEKDVYGDGSVAFPPPNSAQLKELMFKLGSLNAAKVINCSNSIVSVLNNAHVFHGGVDAQRDKRVFLT
jgi:hypothetical protein